MNTNRRGNMTAGANLRQMGAGPSPPVRAARRRVAGVFCLCGLWLFVLQASTVSAADSPPAPPARPVEQVPYRVQVDIAFERGPALDAELRNRIRNDVREGLERYVGEFWHIEIAPDDRSRVASAAALGRLRADQVVQFERLEDVDKAYFLAVETSGAGWRAIGREWDATTRQLSPLVQRSSRDTREAAQLLLTVLRDLFRPLVAVDQVKTGPVTLKARGADFVPRDDGWQALVEGGLFEPYYRYFDKDHQLQKIQQVPWTYLAVEKADRARASCQVTTGIRVALGGRRRRIETVALGVRRSLPATRLTLVTRTAARRPLAGVEVDVALTRDPPPETKGIALAERPPRLVTDRNGLVTIAAHTAAGSPPIVWLNVHSGQALLARLPFVPGIRATDILELPDDSLRLKAEGDLALLQAELVDTVARRAVQAAVARNRAKNKDWTAADAIVKELSDSPRPRFASDLNAIRIPALKAAKAQKNRTAESRIQKLCDETAELIATYLDDDRLKELKEELDELREAEKQDAAAEADGASGNKRTPRRRSSTPSAPTKQTPPVAPAF